MKVLLVAPPIMDVLDGVLQPVGVDALRECPPLGIYTLAACLEAAGHTVQIADLIQAQTHILNSQVEQLGDFDLIGIGSTSMAWPTAVDIISQIRKSNPDTPIVCGGVHPSLFDAHILHSFDVQYVIRGEGELALIELCNAIISGLAMSDVVNLSWLDADRNLVRNPQATKISRFELPKVPLPDLSQLTAGAYKCLAIESSRGCAFDCSFCSTPYRKSWRGIAATEFVDRLEIVLEHQHLVRSDCVHIIDDEFCLNPKRARNIAELINQRGIKAELLYDARAQDVLAPGLLEQIAGLTAGLLIGAECGYNAGLMKIGKGSTCETLEAAAKTLSQHGIADRVDFSFIIGLPWESQTEIKQTIEFATHLYTHYGVHIMLQWYRQIPGSRLWQQAAQQQLVNAAMYDDYGFFRDYYLFSTACQLNPKEIYETGDLIDQLSWIAGLDGRTRPSIVHTLPAAITESFPRHLLDNMQYNDPKTEYNSGNSNYFRLEGVRS